MPGRVLMRSFDESDPIAAAIAPPENESPGERQNRILKERVAKQISDEIDEQLSREKQFAKKQAKPVKVLLLGQSESGKSTTLKNFQLMCEPKAFRAERASWRAIIHLNVVRSVRTILDALAVASSAPEALPPSPRSSASSGSRDSLTVRPDTDLLALRMRLLPLLQIEDELTRRLAHPDTHEQDRAQLTPGTPVSASRTPALFRRRAGKEVAVNSAVAWKHVFMRSPESDDGVRESIDTLNLVDWDDPEDPGTLLHARSEDMQRLWAHPTVRLTLERQGIRLQESSGFFLDELSEVTAPRYVPRDEHILRARLKTLGVSEHCMRLTDPNGGITREFRIFDVGGQRSMRRKHCFAPSTKWVPYFDDMDAIIFLAPISAFDQTLSEDPRVNRLADSVELWTEIASNKLLQKTNLVLFLNKVDIMQAKLAAGIQFADYCPAYGRRPNDFDSASRYLKKQFSGILKQQSPLPRVFYCHLTNVIDTQATANVLRNMQDMLMRFNLKESHLIM
ncbi:guanine nucleotide binding protein, alpha subunit [Mycena pura]|uniref:Guanine nucleotide binding protein, alpha subunit n=1 Tax=Mycena pura TaxID=153505 RepID=A0AAD6UMT8_9AGAR|nr:guanine nucleotide binding protein, alpha subunit [Mycena pura]